MKAASSAPAKGADRRDATRRQVRRTSSTLRLSACRAAEWSAEKALELLEDARQRVAEVVLDEGRRRLAVAALQRLDDLLVLVRPSG